MFRPVSLMRLKKLDRPQDVLKYYEAKDLYIEQKFDGFKVLAVKNDIVHLFTRRGIDFTQNVPTLMQKLDKILPNKTTILGELVILDGKGKQSLSSVQSIVNSHPTHARHFLKECDKNCHLIFYVYDVLEFLGKNLTTHGNSLSLVKRRNILKTFIPSTGAILISRVYPYTQYKTIIKHSLAAGGEGVVIKPKNSVYKYNKITEHEPVGEWFKYKPAHTEDVIIKSYFYRNKEKKAIFPAYQYKNQQLFEVGKLSGMDRITEKMLMNKIDKGESLVVEVNYQEKYPSGKIRAMGWIRDRTKEKNSKDVIWQK